MASRLPEYSIQYDGCGYVVVDEYGTEYSEPFDTRAQARAEKRILEKWDRDNYDGPNVYCGDTPFAENH